MNCRIHLVTSSCFSRGDFLCTPQGILACVECTYSDLVVRDLRVSRLAMELAPEPGMKVVLGRGRTCSFALRLSTEASVSFSLRIFRQSKDTMTLDSNATKANEPMTPAKTTEPTQTESMSSNKGSEKTMDKMMTSITLVLILVLHSNRFKRTSHCLKIIQNVSFEFFNFGIFHRFWHF